jgi:hypothetical protein
MVCPSTQQENAMRYRTHSGKSYDGPVAILGAALVVLPIAAWITHCVWWINLMINGTMEVWQGVLAVLGMIAFPIGVIHGFIIWFS